MNTINRIFMILSLSAILPLSSLWVNCTIGMEMPASLEISEELPRTKIEIMAGKNCQKKGKRFNCEIWIRS